MAIPPKKPTPPAGTFTGRKTPAGGHRSALIERAPTDSGARDRFVAKIPPPMTVEPIGEDFDEPVTGHYEGDPLEEARARARRADKRLQRVEVKVTEQATKHERLAEAVESTKIAVIKIDAKQDAIESKQDVIIEMVPQMIRQVNDSVNRLAEREHVTFTAAVDVSTAKRIDAVNKGADRRKFWLTVAGGIFGGGALFKFLAAMGWL